MLTKQQFQLNSNLLLTKEYAILGGHTNIKSNLIIRISLSKDYMYMATISQKDKFVKIWNLEQKRSITTIYHQCVPECAIFSPNGKYILCSFCDGVIKICSPLTGECLNKVEDVLNVFNFIEISQNNKYFVSLSNLQNSFKLWHSLPYIESSTIFSHGNFISSVAISPDSLQIASGSYDKTVQIWDIKSKTIIQTLKNFKQGVTNVVYSPNGKYIAVSDSSNYIYVVYTENYQQICCIKGIKEGLVKFQFSVDSDKIITRSSEISIKVWKIGSQKCLKTFKGQKNGCIEISQDLKTMIQVTYNQSLLIKNLYSKSKESKLHQPEFNTTRVNSIAISDATDLLATACVGRIISIWELTSGSQINTIKSGHNQLEFFQNGIYLLSKGKREIKIWNVSNSECIFELDIPKGLNSYALTKKNNQILLGRDDKQLELQNLNLDSMERKEQNSKGFVGWALKKLGATSQKPIWTLKSHKKDINKIQFFSKDKQFIACDQNSLQIRKTKNCKLIKLMVNHRQNWFNEVPNFDFTILNCEQRLIVIQNFKELQIWNLKTMRQLNSKNISFSPFTKQLSNCNLIFCSDGRGEKSKVFTYHSYKQKFRAYIQEQFQYFYDCCENKDYFIGLNYNSLQVYKKTGYSQKQKKR